MSTLLQKPLNIVAVSGGLNTPSKTEALVQEILNELGKQHQSMYISLNSAKLDIYSVARFTAINCHNVCKMT